MPPAEQLFAENQLLKERVAELAAQIDWLKKQLFGGGKSEALDRAQLLLKLGELEKKAREESRETITYERVKPSPEKRPVAAEVFAHLPVRETIVIEPEEVKTAPERYEQIGEERTFEVDLVPPQLYKRVIVRPKYRLKDKSLPPVVAPAPARPVAGGYASAGLLAWIALSKYVDHLPLYRLEQMSTRWGAALSRQTMVDWIRIASDWLEPLYRHMHRELLTGGYVQVDETPVKCNDPDHPGGGTSQGYLWVVSRPESDVVFDWRLSRRHGEATTLLTDDFEGVLQSDGYAAYAEYTREHPKVVWVGCWAHARRKFFEAQAEQPKAVRVVLKLIARLYRLERAWDEAGVTPEERTRLRVKHFARTLIWLKRIALHWREKMRPKSLLGQACGYLLGQWEPLTAHVRHGQTRLDNNLVENAIRPSAIGKKNWLFIGHPEAGQRSAIIYSIVVSCQRHGKDTFAYLKDVLTRLPAMTNQDDLAPLTPSRWTPPAQLTT